MQEVIDESREMIFKNKWIQDNYFAKGGCASGNEFIEASYGCMIISKYPCTFYEKNFDSNMGRSLIIAEPCLPENFLIGCVHLESLEMRRRRKA